LFGGLQGDHGTDDRACVPGVAHSKRPDLHDEQGEELLCVLPVYEHALHGYTGLACVGKPAGNNLSGRERQVRPLVDDHAGIPTEFQRHAFLSCPGFQWPADRGTSRESNEGNPFIFNKLTPFHSGAG
jgi:hypothetical protein